MTRLGSPSSRSGGGSASKREAQREVRPSERPRLRAIAFHAESRPIFDIVRDASATTRPRRRVDRDGRARDVAAVPPVAAIPRSSPTRVAPRRAASHARPNPPSPLVPALTSDERPERLPTAFRISKTRDAAGGLDSVGEHDARQAVHDVRRPARAGRRRGAPRARASGAGRFIDRRGERRRFRFRRLRAAATAERRRPSRRDGRRFSRARFLLRRPRSAGARAARDKGGAGNARRECRPHARGAGGGARREPTARRRCRGARGGGFRARDGDRRRIRASSCLRSGTPLRRRRARCARLEIAARAHVRRALDASPAGGRAERRRGRRGRR